jgi:hypothetical protein
MFNSSVLLGESSIAPVDHNGWTTAIIGPVSLHVKQGIMDTTTGFSGYMDMWHKVIENEVYHSTATDFPGRCQTPEYLQGSRQPAHVPVGRQ